VGFLPTLYAGIRSGMVTPKAYRRRVGRTATLPPASGATLPRQPFSLAFGALALHAAWPAHHIALTRTSARRILAI